MFIKEYYIQLPFIIMRLIFHLAGENELVVSNYLEKLLNKLKAKVGLIDQPHDNEDAEMMSKEEEVKFEEILFFRIAFEFTKMYRADRSVEYLDHLEAITVTFEDYSQVFQYLLTSPDFTRNRIVFSEWVKYSLQLAIEDEVTRRNLVSLMFSYIAHVHHSYNDYQHMLKYERMVIEDQDQRTLDLAMEGSHEEHDGGYTDDDQDKQVIEIEIREFRDLD